ncbi:MAG: CoA ester lyase [Sphingomicrobium sp.]
MLLDLFDRPSVLFLPASRASAIAKARESAADIVILDLEDAVKSEDKITARESAVAAVELAWPMPVAIRINAVGSEWHADDLAAVRNAQCDFVVLPLVRDAHDVAEVAESTGKPVAAMIETAAGVIAAPEIAKVSAALIVGTNDLSADLRLPSATKRSSLQAALQLAVISARAAGVAVFDGVHNVLDDAPGFAAAAAEGRDLGFDGKSLIHPSQIALCRTAFAPAAAEVDRAERLIAAATGGAERFEGEMIETMHVDAARRLLDRRT